MLTHVYNNYANIAKTMSLNVEVLDGLFCLILMY